MAAGGAVIFERDDWVAREMARRAEVFVNRSHNLYVDLDYSDASVELADNAAVRMWTAAADEPPGEKSQERRGHVIFDFGAYFGETFIRNHGGSWGWASLDDRRVLALRTDTGVTAFPLARARKRLRGEEPGSVVDLYRFLSSRRSPAANR